ncbi:hypothetical protein BU047_09945 [Staphylococcus simulans]|uniref:hypothetical protein n=1 Tax=Staphylococcus simulans TaxID=1286 RepID=UPI000D1F3C16|nr:hypothetical protein [Staphylococcus simulans]PTJ01590.1 hypothetical protein BU047_09945 [Staphylococcus simulans]
MKHYLYTDKDFIYSTLSQIGKGLNLSYSQMSKNTSTESESTETSNTKEEQNIEGYSSGDIGGEISFKVIKGSYSDGTDYEVTLNKNSIKDTFNLINSKSEAQSELHEIELHDYLYEIFESSIDTNDRIQKYQTSPITIIEMENEYFDFLDSIVNLYSKDPTASFINVSHEDRLHFKDMSNQLKPIKKIASIFNQFIPGDYKLMFDYENQTLICPLYKQNLKIPLRELKYFESKNRLTIIGILVGNVEEQVDGNEKNPLEALQIDKEMLPELLRTLTNKSTYYFKPILIYSEF